MAKGGIMKKAGSLTWFAGNYSFLSNFYHSPFVADDKLTYPTVEHYFHAHKTLVPHEKTAIRQAITPARAKLLGRRCTLRKDWEKVKADVMKKGLKYKFQSGKLWSKLSAIKVDLIEGNWWHDNIWGDCVCDKCKDIPGQNLLGKLLMELRDGGR